MTKTASTFILHWVREDGQGSYDMGEYSTEAEAEGAIPAMEAVLLDQCGEDYQKDEIKAGRWGITETERE